MKIIICKTDDAEILVDDEDYPVLARFPWYRGGKSGHPMTFFYGRNDSSQTVYMHQILSGGAVQTDHKDGNVLNMQKDNLRAATWQENGWNKGKPKRCKHGQTSSQYKGVSYVPLKGKDRWVALIKHVEAGKDKSTGKVIRIGYFDTEREAAIAYDKKVLELRGKWAWTNILNKQEAQVG